MNGEGKGLFGADTKDCAREGYLDRAIDEDGVIITVLFLFAIGLFVDNVESNGLIFVNGYIVGVDVRFGDTRFLESFSDILSEYLLDFPLVDCKG